MGSKLRGSSNDLKLLAEAAETNRFAMNGQPSRTNGHQRLRTATPEMCAIVEAMKEQETKTLRNLSRAITLAVVAWLSIATLNWLSRASYTPQAVVAVTAAVLLLAAAVWWLTGRYVWPEEPRVSFLVVHALLGLGFVAVLLGLGYQVQALTTGESLMGVLRRSRLLRWEVLLGLWLYGLIAGVSYAQRFKEHMLRQRRIAAEAEALATRAQLSALKAQLNPHFLFNALHSISALVDVDGPAAQALERLGQLLRYALDEHAGHDVTLAEEWAFTQDYLELEKIGMGSRLQIDAEIAPEALRQTLPSFTLQTLVENAVRHGIADRPGGGLLCVRVTLEDGSLVLRVVNDVADATVHPASLHDRNGQGLHRLRQLLEARFGDRAELTTGLGEGHRFEAEVSILAEAATP